MAIVLILVRPGGAVPEGTVTWDPDTGELTGSLAGAVRAMAEDAKRAGAIVSAPVPTAYPITDPLHDRREMAAILATRWQLPDVLAGELASAEQAEPSDVSPVH